MKKSVQCDDIQVTEKDSPEDLKDRMKTLRQIRKGTLFSVFSQCNEPDFREFYIAAFGHIPGQKVIAADFLNNDFRCGCGSMPRVILCFKNMWGLEIHRR